MLYSGIKFGKSHTLIGKTSITLEQATSTAITCEKYVQQRKELHHDRIDDSRKRAYCHLTEPQTEDTPETKRRRCYQCKAPGHIARNCPTQNNLRPYCNFCKIIGHPFEACRKRLRTHSSTNFASSQPSRQFSSNNNPQPLNSQVIHHMGAMTNPPNPNISAPQPAPSSLPPPLMGQNPRW